jgi:hypothetical protein
LAVNHLVGENDLDWNSPLARGVTKGALINRYSACPIRTGEVVIAEELWRLPRIGGSTGRLAYPLSIGSDPRLVETVNAGSRVDLWHGSQLVGRDISVLAVVCSQLAQSQGTDCWAILDVGLDEVSRVKERNVDSLVITKSSP